MKSISALLTLALTVAITGCGQESSQVVVPEAPQSPAATEAKSALEKALDAGDAMAVAAAAGQLKDADDSTDLVALLVRGLSNDNTDVRETCSEQLVQLAPDKPEVVRALMDDGLQDQDAGVQRNAAEALGAIGPPAKDAVPALNQLQQDPAAADDVRKAATDALDAINHVDD